MGSSSFSHDDYSAREMFRKSTGTSAFVYDHAIKTGKTAATVNAGMNPFGVKMRECRDSDAHPVSIPMIISMDVTGSMQEVPQIFQKALPNLMSQFLESKASGKQYLGDGYPSILIAAHDDYLALDGAAGTVQAGQFESGLEIDDDLGKIWFTGQGGGGEPRESYELMMYFAARHTVHDHWEKRGKKGFLFLFGDEKPYGFVRKDQVKAIFGDDIQADIPVAEIARECSKRYHVIYVQPCMTSHWKEDKVLQVWRDIITTEQVLLLEDPAKICELIVSTVTLLEGQADLEDLRSDNVATGLDMALVPLSNRTGDVSRYDASALPALASASGVERL